LAKQSSRALDAIQERIVEHINWNYIGIVAGIMSVIVAFYNIFEYTKKLKEK